MLSLNSRLLCLLISSLLCSSTVQAQTPLALWKNLPPTADTETDSTTEKSDLIAGRRVQRITGVHNPTITFYPAPAQANSKAAVVVFPGGGYRILAYDLEGTEVCEWLNSISINCVLLKYRVPDAGPYPEHAEDLADAQRAVRITRARSKEWDLDPSKIGVLGFSAGGHLAAVLGRQANQQIYAAQDATDQLSALPNFSVIVYPGLLREKDGSKLRTEVVPQASTPPTLLVQAEDDPVHVENALLYFQALKDAGVPAEMHVFAQGKHGYGLRPTALPVTKWNVLAAQWFRTIGVLPPSNAAGSSSR